MPDLWMDVDTALAEVPVNLLPLLDDTDFKTREVAIAYNAAGMDLVWNFVTCAGAYTQTAVTPTTSGTYDWAHQGDGMYSIEIPASGGASINNDTEGHGWFTGVATGVLPWRGPVIGFRAAGLNDALIENSNGQLDVRVVTMANDTVTAAAIADNAIDAGAIASNALTAAKIATDAITSSQLAASAVTEIQSGLATAVSISDVASDLSTVQSSISTLSGKIDTVDDFLDTEMAATLAAVLNLVAAGYTHTGTAQAGAAGTVTLASGASSSDDYYNNQIVVIASGTGAGQARFISDYTGSSRVAAVATWVTNPDNTSVYYVLPFGAIAGATAPTAVEIRQEIDNNSTQLAAIKAKTDNLPSDPADQSLVIAATTAIFDRVGAPAGASVSADIAAVKTQTAAIETDTQDIQSRLPAALVGGRMSSDAVAISGDTAAADNLESMLDGTGGVTLTTALVGNITGNLSGSVGSVTGAVGSVSGAVGSVTGAVGSVTGNVGGNVVGSVASVTGNVGGNVAGSVGSVTAGVTVTTNNDKTGYRLSATGVDDIHDEVVDGSTTFRQSVRLQNSAAGGKISGAATTTVVIRDLADSKDRVSATVDADGNRSAVTRDLT